MKTLENKKYSIDDNFEIRIWHTEQDESQDNPIFYQPHNLYGEKWASAEEAEAWAVNFITPAPVVEEDTEPVV
jgi:hypothetical protein